MEQTHSEVGSCVDKLRLGTLEGVGAAVVSGEECYVIAQQVLEYVSQVSRIIKVAGVVVAVFVLSLRKQKNSDAILLFIKKG